jgi:hypothetical protein
VSARWQRLLTTARGISDDRLASGLAVILGSLVALLPLLVGQSDAGTTLLVFGIGGLVILPMWRSVGGELRSPLALIAFVGFVGGLVVIAWLFGRPLIWTYIGGFACTLGFMRFATNWRDDA